ncbi:Solute-binding protein [subsurface metagenome]
MQSPIFIATFKALKALPTPIPWAELYMALQQGVVDAQENPVVNIYGAKLYEVQKYLSLTGHTYDPNIYFINKDFFYNLPQEYQEILRETAKEVITWQREQAQRDEKAQLQELAEYMEINQLSTQELVRFRAQCKSVYEEQEKFIGKEIIEKWVNAVE